MTELEDSSDGPCADAVLDRDLPAPAPATHAEDDSPAWAKAGALRRVLLSNSLGPVMGGIFLLSWLAQSVAGVSSFNERQLSQRQEPVSWMRYLVEPDFWNRTLQNWRSEFLAVVSMAVLSIYLRQRGSPESKPVGSAHGSTGVEG